MTFQKAGKGRVAKVRPPTAIETRGEPFEQAQIRAACGATGFNPRDGHMPVGRKVSKQKQD